MRLVGSQDGHDISECRIRRHLPVINGDSQYWEILNITLVKFLQELGVGMNRFFFQVSYDSARKFASFLLHRCSFLFHFRHVNSFSHITIFVLLNVPGDNGIIDGQGSVWWESFSSHSLNYSRPRLVENIGCKDVVVSNLTFLNSPAWNIHPVYCSNVQVQNITIHAPPESPHAVGIVPDSSDNVCIEDSSISVGYDAISFKSGWDEYGIAYGRSTRNVHIRGTHLQGSTGSALAFGSEMSGGISDIIVEGLHIHNSFTGIAFKTTKGRGGYIKDIFLSYLEMENVYKALKATGQFGSHPDDKFDPNALPVIDRITLENIVGTNINVAGDLEGIQESPFTSICLSNVSFLMTFGTSASWYCSSVLGFSDLVFPEPCLDLKSSYSNSSSASFSLASSDGYAAAS
ncbi:probable polygalacturonase [Telopea speciosissima]|uniref:probable polygalacturonase n=1 Tax=Telopea speciosissima TaxID=54955 RepID=UPI001CC527E1|nr:probable polygalacturonase [Telopea speciosissima]